MQNPSRKADALWLMVILLGMLWLSRDYGITFDEGGQQDYGVKVYRYFESLFKNRESFTYSNLYLYGGLFDVVAVWLQRLLPSMDIWDVRHLLNAFTAWVGYVYVFLLGRLLGGRGVGWAAVLLLLCSPMYFSHFANNPKDMPFASFYLASVYYMMIMWRELPELRLRTLGKLWIAVALTINMRVGGILLICYMEMLLGLWVAQAFVLDRVLLSPARLRWILAVAVLAPPLMIIGGTAGWPWAQWQPLLRPLKALASMSQFEWAGMLRFNGRMVASNDLPWTYAPWWFFLTTPFLVLLAECAGIVAMWRQGLRRELAFLIFCGVFPVVYVIAKHSVLYNGVRHLLFVYPPLIPIAGYGLFKTLEFARQRWRAKPVWFAVPVLTAALAAEPIAFAIRNHPNEGVYFSPLIGGTKGAYKKFDLDYWGNCQKAALRWLGQVSHDQGQEMRVEVGYAHFAAWEPPPFGKLVFVYPGERADYVLRGINDSDDPATIENGRLANVVHRVEAEGVTLCYISKLAPKAP